jgi:hypothetical protein
MRSSRLKALEDGGYPLLHGRMRYFSNWTRSRAQKINSIYDKFEMGFDNWLYLRTEQSLPVAQPIEKVAHLTVE